MWKGTREIGRFLLSGIWAFFLDPAGWWEEAKGSLMEMDESAPVALENRRIRADVGIHQHDLLGPAPHHQCGEGDPDDLAVVLGAPVFTLISSVVHWGITKASSGTPSQRSDQMSQMLRCMREMSRQIDQL